jgi:hypothetical protein
MSIRVKPFKWSSEVDDNRYHTIEYLPEAGKLIETTFYGWPTIDGLRYEIEDQYTIDCPTIEDLLNAWKHGFIC